MSAESEIAILYRLRARGAWRIGPESGARDRTGRILHSDSLYSGVTWAMAWLGYLEDWLKATTSATPPAVRLSSGFPWQGSRLFIVPPQHLWPPPESSRVRWKGARFVPVTAVADLLRGKPLNEDAWAVDSASECLVPANVPAAGPLRPNVRVSAAVDRWGAAVEPHATACIEFAADAGVWFCITFADSESRAQWHERVTASVRLLADSGLGGERSRGWGGSELVEAREGPLAELLFGKTGWSESESGHWLLSLYSPAERDEVDWTRGAYALATRTGRVESEAASGGLKKTSRMIREGSVIVTSKTPVGAATDVAPEGFAHPVYRAGYAVSISVPLRPSA